MVYKRIIHVSDIHIRAGDSQISRYREYTKQIDNLLQAIKNYEKESTIVVLTGDIFEHKHTLGPSGQLLAQQLFKGLSSLFTTLVIRGNHDYRQDQPDEPDLINPFFQEDCPNLHYIDETGLYEFDNIEFGIVAVQDTLIRGAKGGINSELPEFPEPSPKQDKDDRRIALFHGTVGGSLLQNGRQVEERNNYPLRTWIKGYDAILLGDIHLQQVHCVTTIPGSEFLEQSEKNVYLCSSHTINLEQSPWAYAGSLIQQNAGESPWGHGFLVWDLDQNSITGYHIRNETGIIVVGLNDAQEPRVRIRVGKKDRSLTIDTATALGWFPKAITLKFNQNARSQVQTIVSQFEEAKIKVLSTGFQEDLTEETALQTETKASLTHDLASLNSPDEWIKFFSEETKWEEGEWSNWIKAPELLTVPNEVFPPDLATKIQDRNTKFQKTTDTYLKERDARPPVRAFRLHYMEFSWLLCFGANNYLDFDAFIKKVALINGNNGSGKSSLLEIIGIAIFGESFPSRYSKTYSASIINQHKPDGEHAAYTKICFSVDNKKYWIHRTFDSQPANNKNIWQRIIRLIDDETGTILKQNANCVNPWLKEHIGTYEHFLLTTIMTQSSDSDFFSMQGSSQKAIIDSLLQLDVCENFRALLKEARLNHDYALGHLTTYETGLQRTKSDSKPVNVDELTARLDQVRDELEAVMADLKQHRASLKEIPEKAFQLQLSYYESEVAKYEKIIESTDNILEDIDQTKKERSLIRDRLAVLKSKKYSVQPVTTKPEQTFDELEHTLQEKRQSRPQIKCKPYNKEQHQAFLQTYTEQQPHNKSIGELERTLEELQSELSEYDIDESYKPISNKILTKLEAQDKTLTDELEALDIEIQVTTKELKRLQPSAKEAQPLAKYKESLKELTAAFNCTFTEATYRIQQATMIHMETAHLQSELDSMATELATVATIKYEAKCNACLQNPYRKKKEELLSKKTHIEQKLKDLAKSQTALLKTETPYKTLIDIYTRCKALHSDKIVSLMDAEQRITELEQTLITLNKKYNEKEEQKEEIQYDTLKTVNEYFDLLAKTAAQEKELNAALKEKEFKDWAQAKELHDLDLQILELQAKAQQAYSYEYINAETRIRDLEHTIQTFEQRTTATKKLQEYTDIINAYSSYNTVHALDAKYKPLAQEEASLMVRIETVKERHEELNAAKTENERVANARLYLETRSKQVSTMEQTFERFTDQLYPLKVGPAIEAAVNTVLSSIALPRPIKLKAVWDSGNFTWFMEDGDSCPPYEKCSGAQRFFAGLALRLAFGRMGASNMINAQFFLDEGFTACDVETMERVPDLLKNLLKDIDYMQTIFIVSHLETLKTVADESIMLIRGAQATSLQVGTRQEPPKAHKPEEEQKKRGRPKKAPQ